MKRKLIGLMAISVFLLSGCVNTALWGSTFKTTSVEHQYTLKVTYGGFFLPQVFADDVVDEKTRPVVENEAYLFMTQNKRYNDFEILGYERDVLLSFMTYTVEFKEK